LKRFRFILLLVIFVFALNTIIYADSEEEVYVIPIKGEINRATRNYVKSTVEELNSKDVGAIIFTIDTDGGLIEEAIKIKDIIVSTDIPTVSFVNSKATSAGVLITIASENVVMASNATMGSAEPIPNTEKILSYWRSVLRDTAQYRGRDVAVIEAMADKDVEIEGVNKTGKLVNITSEEALDLGIADYISDDYADIANHFGFNNSNIKERKEGLQIKLSKYIANPYLSSTLLTIAFVGLVVEVLTPGFGIGGTISIIGFGLYFGGNILAGNSQWSSLALFITGLILLVIEAMIPGFGLPGISGIIFVSVGIILAMDSFGIALISLSVAVIITAIVTIILLKLGFRSKIFDSIVLSPKSDDKEHSSLSAYNAYLDKEGVTKTDLRPSGFIEIDGERLDALSDEGFIQSDTKIRVVKVEGRKIFVRRR